MTGEENCDEHRDRSRHVFALSLPVWLAIDETMRHRRVVTSFSVHDADRIRKLRAASAGVAISLFVALAWPGGAFEKARVMPISSYDDDPFVVGAHVEGLADSGFARAADGPLLLSTSLVKIRTTTSSFARIPCRGTSAHSRTIHGP